VTFDAIWLQLCDKSIHLTNDEAVVEFRSKNLKILLRQVYEQGRRSVPVSTPVHDPGNWFDDIFGSFGRK
jgi:hypothetical protein